MYNPAAYVRASLLALVSLALSGGLAAARDVPAASSPVTVRTILAKSAAALKAAKTVHVKGFMQVKLTNAKAEGGPRKIFVREHFHSDSTVGAPFQATGVTKVHSNYNGSPQTQSVYIVVRGTQAAYRTGAQGGWQCTTVSKLSNTSSGLGNTFGVPGFGAKVLSAKLAGTPTVAGVRTWHVKFTYAATFAGGHELVHASEFIAQNTQLPIRLFAHGTAKVSGGYTASVYLVPQFSSYGETVEISWPC
jgi:hypothetical protein